MSAKPLGQRRPARLGVPGGLRRSLGQFLAAEHISLEVISEGDCEVRVVEPLERQQADISHLPKGGWIACETARAMAKKRLRISYKRMGMLLNFLDIKVRRCGLGCFR